MAYTGQPSHAGAQWQPSYGGASGQFNYGSQVTPDYAGVTDMHAHEQIPGYVAYGTGPTSLAPAHQRPQAAARAGVEVHTSAANITEDEARDALIQYVDQFCCYGSQAAKKMTIESISPSSALHYILETYTESRSTGMTWEPYNGYDPVDGPTNGTPPSKWEIPCSPRALFYSEARNIEVPHTASVSPCHDCNGMGFNKCHRCHGDGRVPCSSCSGSGRVSRTNPEGQRVQESCSQCMGVGKRRCDTCGGDGRITCRTCRGQRNLKHFLMLTVNFINHKSDHIIEKTGVPKELLRDVSGAKVFEQTAVSIEPVSNYPVQEIVYQSARLVDEHRQAYSGIKKLQQRHGLHAVPVTQCIYQWKEKHYYFWVYGNERCVYAPDYPQQNCLGCSVL
ncbi:protein SSUH2 homolog [Ptychodera flava]|uniref:protein SSUH2 homolog n=1 Tax=Ptychodera flava TaxID=63121 RepID=UPI00396A219E